MGSVLLSVNGRRLISSPIHAPPAAALDLGRSARDCGRNIEDPMPARDRKPPRTGGQFGHVDRKSGHSRPPARDRDPLVLLYGWHTVKAALENPARRIRRLLVTENAARRLADQGCKLAVEPELVRPNAIAALLGPEAVHNGLYAEADPLPSPALDEIEPTGIAMVLDQITDPHNVGAILRTAAAFAVSAVVTTARHSPDATGVLAKSASGALEYVPMVTVPNLARALDALKQGGFLTVGLDSTGERRFEDATLGVPLALVLGAEGKGLRELTRATCDQVARIDVPGRIKSLNVSNAAALALYVATVRITSNAESE
jgi:23S rRNA (guanosine2251-2'-O)-methyltransferase